MKKYAYEGKLNLSGARIQQARKSVKLSQEQMAARMQVKGIAMNQQAISRIELGEQVVPDFELLAFAEVLEVDVMWLLTGEGKGPGEKPS